MVISNKNFNFNLTLFLLENRHEHQILIQKIQNYFLKNIRNPNSQIISKINQKNLI
jgi:hypothetical protein